MGADEVIDFTEEDPVAAIKRLTGGRGVDVAIEALGTQETFQWCLEATRPGGIVSSLGVYGGKLEIPVEPFVYGIGDKRILSTLCPGGKERMRTLMELVRHGRLDLSKLITHRFPLDADRGGLRALRATSATASSRSRSRPDDSWKRPRPRYVVLRVRAREATDVQAAGSRQAQTMSFHRWSSPSTAPMKSGSTRPGPPPARPR